MELLLLRSKCSIFHTILKTLTFQSRPMALVWSKGLKLLNSLHVGLFCMLVLISAHFFQNKLLQEILSGTLSECQIFVSPDQDRHLSVLIWVQNCLQRYQQTIKVGTSAEKKQLPLSKFSIFLLVYVA